ncbi:MAG: Rieske 2Fe-2S domain-containing protein [Candidatus Lambdaproteobacteria bacterium]|nr:Rieske 2Fe-2S domain-containing protein [Candidatus Lambdaproteobacteria bacterium]
MRYDYAALVQDGRVHGSLYVDPGVFHEEMERIFRRGWVFVGHESELPAPGDWVTRRVGLQPYLLTRDLDGGLHLLANRCAHRGTALCREERGNARHFQCIFHGWTFGLDGTLLGVTYPGGLERSKEALALDRAGQIDTYRGFIFANPAGGAGPLAEHLGPGGRYLIDRMCNLAPSGRIRLGPNWIGQRVDSNWKLWPESDNDGYHLNFLHVSLFRANRESQYNETMLAGETGHSSKAVDHGRGHFELDLKDSYPHELAWCNATPERLPDYRRAMVAAHGEARAHQLLLDGPPHGMIFPNLFLGEINVAMVEPIAPGVCAQYHTAMQLEGAGEAVNRRLLRLSEAAMGPASFLLADDAAAAERQQYGFGASRADLSDGGAAHTWVDLSRGQRREQVAADGVRVSLLSDETTNRGFWRHYRSVMEAGA